MKSQKDNKLIKQLEIKELYKKYNEKLAEAQFQEKLAYKEEGGLRKSGLNLANNSFEEAKTIKKKIDKIESELGEWHLESYYENLEAPEDL